MVIIANVHGREVMDSRGNPTVQAEVTLSDGSVGIATVPSGASTGVHEALELRDLDMNRYRGMGVENAVSNINNDIKSKILGMDAEDQSSIDESLIELDGTSNKSNLGANSMLGVSLAIPKAIAISQKIPLFQYFGGENATLLPVPFFNILNGGAHAVGSTDYQEFMIAPVGANSFKEALRMGNEVYHSLKKLLLERNLSTHVGDEGGFAPNLRSNSEAIELILVAIESAGFNSSTDCKLALDVAASELWNSESGTYRLDQEGISLTSFEMVERLTNLVNNYPIISIEDGLAEDDWDGWKQLTKEVGNKVQLVGDDLYVTDMTRLQKGISENAGNSILIKFNQVGTLSETLNVIKLAQSQSFSTMISHRSGETEDTTIADLAVGLRSGQIKAGATARGERTAKYNRLLVIEEILGDRAVYAGNTAFLYSNN